MVIEVSHFIIKKKTTNIFNKINIFKKKKTGEISLLCSDIKCMLNLNPIINNYK